MEQPEFSLTAEETRKTRADQIYADFVKSHRRCPEVWVEFEKMTLDYIRIGRKKYSAYAILERIRWEVAVGGGDEVKINNSHIGYYARLFMVAHPEHEGFFEIRVRKSEQKAANPNDKQVFIAPDASDESYLRDRLRGLLKEDACGSSA